MRSIGFTDKDGGAVSEGDVVELVFLHPVRGPYKKQARVVLSDGEWWFQLPKDENGRIEMLEAAHHWHHIHRVVSST